MFKQSYGRRAAILSCCIHCLLFIGAGWLGGDLFSKAAEPETIEMELISSVALPEQAVPVPITIPQASAPVEKPVVPDQSRPMPAVPQPLASSDVVADRFSPVAAPSAGSPAAEEVPALATGQTTGVVAPPAPKRIAAPRILNKVEPDYPQDARQEGVSGTVGVKVEVLENGRPGEVMVARSSGRRSLDEAAVQAVRQWRFVPAQETGSGQAVRCFTTFSIVFELS